ncbi:hypothetical protein ACGFYQ_19740 [Streptomyces sp. NPDC048258]|uniref:hypothetical protein n=1 Tax=Streptomyces sp. NPDC048258 TaxID=3365527 RepID=UPI00371A4EC9
MPRKRPGALRAERGGFEGRRPPAWAWELPSVDRLSPAPSAEVHWALGARSGNVAGLLSMYRRFLRTPGRRLWLVTSGCPGCPGCALDDVAVVRDELAGHYRALPPEARRALGRVLRLLDEEFRRRTFPDPDPPAAHWADRSGGPYAWWHRRLYADHR